MYPTLILKLGTFTDTGVMQENCWAMTSIILELLEMEGQGTYLHGKLCFPEWAPEVRERVQSKFVSTLCASAPVE